MKKKRKRGKKEERKKERYRDVNIFTVKSADAFRDSFREISHGSSAEIAPSRRFWMTGRGPSKYYGPLGPKA